MIHVALIAIIVIYALSVMATVHVWGVMGMCINSIKNNNCGNPWGETNCTIGVTTTTTMASSIATSTLTVTSSSTSSTTTDASIMDISKSGGNNKNVGIIVGSVVGGIFLIGILILIIFLRRKRTFKKLPKQRNLTNSIELKSSVDKMILNIKIGERIGGGAFSDVYKGQWNVNKYTFSCVYI